MKHRLTLLFLGLVVLSYSQEKIDDYKKIGNYVWKIVPKLLKNQLIFSIIDFRVFYKNNNYEFINKWKCFYINL